MDLSILEVIRKEQKLTKGTIADKTCLSRHIVGKILANAHGATFADALKVIEFLGYNVTLTRKA